MQNLGEKLKRLRIDKGLSMEKMAEKFKSECSLHITISMISRWENGKAEPSSRYLVGYAKCFHADLNLLLDVHESYSPSNGDYTADDVKRYLAKQKEQNIIDPEMVVDFFEMVFSNTYPYKENFENLIDILIYMFDCGYEDGVCH